MNSITVLAAIRPVAACSATRNVNSAPVATSEIELALARVMDPAAATRSGSGLCAWLGRMERRRPEAPLRLVGFLLRPGLRQKPRRDLHTGRGDSVGSIHRRRFRTTSLHALHFLDSNKLKRRSYRSPRAARAASSQILARINTARNTVKPQHTPPTPQPPPSPTAASATPPRTATHVPAAPPHLRPVPPGSP
jgi:hypothetical protein